MEKVQESDKMPAFLLPISCSFNRLPAGYKKRILIAFALLASTLCALPVTTAIKGAKYEKAIAIDSIKIVTDIHMKNRNAVSESQLVPVGKFKGEIDGTFEAFYLAVDADGKTYINRSLEYTREAYQKSNGWMEVTREELERFKQVLHFLPVRSKGIRH